MLKANQLLKMKKDVILKNNHIEDFIVKIKNPNNLKTFIIMFLIKSLDLIMK
jgi:predicted acyltransferase (DUF342 family)